LRTHRPKIHAAAPGTVDGSSRIRAGDDDLAGDAIAFVRLCKLIIVNMLIEVEAYTPWSEPMFLGMIDIISPCIL